MLLPHMLLYREIRSSKRVILLRVLSIKAETTGVVLGL